MSRIVFEDVSVTFPVHTPQSLSLRRSVLAPRIGAFFRSIDSGKRVCIDALSNVSFSLQPGDRLALLGHNGSGKSTLLKVLAGVYKPTSGRADVEGRRLALYNIGQGMSIEASGRENIMALGLLQGRSRAEVAAATDGIVEFSELQEYIDLPVRTYSSGMTMRLAFAVMTYWDAEILLIDEIIGAGDATFFEKARTKVEALAASSGIAVIASHSTDILRMMANKGLVMNRGRLDYIGSIEDAISHYGELIHSRQ